jgi:ubiquinol-cytochrome c reductase cytochrome b subunit
MWKTFYSWLDERTGVEGLIRKINDEPIRGGARWAFVFGSAVLILLVLQFFTGIFLTMYYVPTSDHAHASVAFIQKAVSGGALLRGLHYYGSSAIIILVIFHFAQTFLFGAYKEKRELLWISGLLMLLLVLAFGFTGYLLPWTQEAYFGTKVGTSIMGEVPVGGPLVERIMLGGREITTLTLSRFFTLHVWLLPLIVILLAGIHLVVFRRSGPAGPYHHRDDARTELFYPRQAFLDALVFLFIFIVLVVLSLKLKAPLGQQADPTTDYLARPPWYFLPLFELLKYFPGNLTLVPAVVLPGIAFIVLAVLPFFDRKEERHPLRRPVATILMLLGLFGSGGLVILSKYQDDANPDLRAKIESQRQEELAYLDAPFQPEEIGRSLPITVPMVPVMGNLRNPVLKIYFANCANCHGRDATGGALGPSLIRLASSRQLSKDFLLKYISGHVREPSPDSMPRFQQLSLDQQSDLANWLLNLSSPDQLGEPGGTTVQTSLPSAPKPAAPAAPATGPGKTAAKPGAPEAFLKTCAFCHGNDAGGNIGPSLVGITAKPQRSPEDLLKLLDDSRAYGLKDPMPASFPKLSADDKKAIVDWLSKLQ